MTCSFANCRYFKHVLSKVLSKEDCECIQSEMRGGLQLEYHEDLRPSDKKTLFCGKSFRQKTGEDKPDAPKIKQNF